MIPFLFEMRPSDIHGPLADLMGAIYERGSAEKNKEEFRKLLGSLNTSKNPQSVEKSLGEAVGASEFGFDRQIPALAPNSLT